MCKWNYGWYAFSIFLPAGTLSTQPKASDWICPLNDSSTSRFLCFMFPLKCASGGRQVMGQNGVAERTASKHRRTWGSEGSWANRELNDLEPFPSSLWALLPLIYIRKDLQWVSALYSEMSQRGYFKSNTSSFQAVSLVRKITFTRKSAMLMSSWKFSHPMCGNVCLQTRMDTQETQKRFL